LSRLQVVLARLGASLALCGLTAATAVAAPACERTLWGCPPAVSNHEVGKDAPNKYADLCARGRRALRYAYAGSTRDLAEALTDLNSAVQLAPGEVEGWALLGAVLLELGRYEEAEPALRRAEALGDEAASQPFVVGEKPAGEAAPPRPGALASLDPHLEVAVATGLAFLDALHGDVRGALERSRRLIGRRAQSHRALWRLADLLMALGNLEEATTFYERACTLPRGPGSSALDVARACHGLLVALDRSERARSAYFLRRVAMLDPDHHSTEMPDIYPPCDREYYRALLLRPGCPRLAAFQSYLRAAREQPGIPGSYLRRAEEHLSEERNQSCMPDF
jgi:cytochrome c-type biogenesis protein CcmH/NrfG